MKPEAQGYCLTFMLGLGNGYDIHQDLRRFLAIEDSVDLVVHSED